MEASVGDGAWVTDYHIFFNGPCTCEHDEDAHGWEQCDEDECPCRAHLAED